MIAHALPDFPAERWPAVYANCHQIAGRTMYAVTIRSRAGTRPEREWFADPDQAYAFGLAQADSRALPFFDLTAGDSGAD